MLVVPNSQESEGIIHSNTSAENTLPHFFYQPIFEKMSFDGVYLIEYEPLEDPKEGIQRSLDYLHQIVTQVDLEG